MTGERDHCHCPLGCEHPQPFWINCPLTGPREVCGRCWVKNGDLTNVVPCTPEVCGEDDP